MKLFIEHKNKFVTMCEILNLIFMVFGVSFTVISLLSGHANDPLTDPSSKLLVTKFMFGIMLVLVSIWIDEKVLANYE